MGNLSLGEIVILLVIALLVFGSKGLPEAGKTVGKGLREFKRALNEAQDAMNQPDDPAAPSTPRTTGPVGEPPTGRPKRLLE